MHTREWRQYIKHHMTFRIIRIWPLKERKKESGGKKCDSDNTIQATTTEAALTTVIFSSLCIRPVESLQRHPPPWGGVSCSPDWTDTPALCDQPRVLLQELHLRHTDPEKPEMTVPGKMLLGLTPDYFQSPLILPSPFQQPSHREESKRRKSLKPKKEKLTK